MTNLSAPTVLRLPVSRATVRRCRAVRSLRHATWLAWRASRSIANNLDGDARLLDACFTYQWPIWC